MTNIPLSFTTTGQGELGLMSVGTYGSGLINYFTPTPGYSTTVLEAEVTYPPSPPPYYGGVSALGNLDTNLILSVTSNYSPQQTNGNDVTAIGVTILPQTVSNEPDLFSLQLLKNGQPIPGSRTFKNLITSPTPIVGATANSPNNAGISGNTDSVTVSISPNNGSSLYVTIQAVGVPNYNGYIESVSDGINIYREAQNNIFLTGFFLQNTIWYADNIQTNGSPLNVTVTFSSPIELYVELTEIIGANKTNSFDSAGQFYSSAVFSPDPVSIVVPNNFSNELGLVSVVGYTYNAQEPPPIAIPITSIISSVVSGHVINQIYNTEETTDSTYFAFANLWGNLNENSNFSIVFNPNTNDDIAYFIFGVSIIPESSQYENIGQLVGGAIFEANLGDIIQLANNRIEDTYLEGYILPVPEVVNSVAGYSNSLSVTLSVTQGNSIYVCIEAYDSSTTTYTNVGIQDNQNNTYKQALIQQQSYDETVNLGISGVLSVFIYYFDNLKTSGSLTVEATLDSSTIVTSTIQVFEISGADPSGSLDGTTSIYSPNGDPYGIGYNFHLTPPVTSQYDLGLISVAFLTESPTNSNYISPNPNVIFLNAAPDNLSLLGGYGNLNSSSLGGTVWNDSENFDLVAGAVSIKPAPINNLNNASLELVLLP